MLYSALKYEQDRLTNSPHVNVGDMVQTIAALQFLPRCDYYIERRQTINAASSLPQSFCIMNGWYGIDMLPLPANIIPFYISIHISKQDILTSAVVDHFKQHEPIGCRDASTLAFLQEKGIDAYYSGCITLTLKRQNKKRLGHVYLINVDDCGLELIPDDIKQRAINMSYTTPRHLSDIIRIAKGKIIRPLPGKKEFLRELIEIPKVFINPSYRSLFPQIWTEKDLTNLLHLFKAQSLLDLYSQADLVITSRLHATLPCIALGTPVIFLPRKGHLSGNPRFEIAQRYIPLNMNQSTDDIDWTPQPINSIQLENHQRFLRMICQKAVEMGKNPLQEIPLKHFLEESLWDVNL